MGRGAVQREGKSVKMGSGKHRPGFALVALKVEYDFPCAGLYCSSMFYACKRAFGKDFNFFKGA